MVQYLKKFKKNAHITKFSENSDDIYTVNGVTENINNNFD
jgi:hypothetical protein